MPDAVMQPCAAAETSIARFTRYAAGASLVLFATAQCAMACLIWTDHRGTPPLLYLLCSVGLFAASVIAVRERRHALVAVRVLAVAAAVMLVWSVSVSAGPGVTVNGRLHDLTPLLAGMLLAVVWLPGLLRVRDSGAACNCG